MEVGIVGLGKMGLNLALNLNEHQHEVKGFDSSVEVSKVAESHGVAVYPSLENMLNAFSERRIIWLMLPSGQITENVLQVLLQQLRPNDIVIEGGNSNFKDSIRRAAEFKEKGINYLDCGTSGGISGARNSACLMIGGDKKIFTEIEVIFSDVSIEKGYLYSGKSGSGHFLKMIHNGIEYGMMQAIGEGFQLVEQSTYDFELSEVARVWNNGSVIRSWLMEIMEEQLSKSPRLEKYKGVVDASGEAKWTIETALDMEVPVPTIALSLFMRNLSQEEDSFSAKVVSALRNGFGGHEIIETK
ncbi:6-phosphogluconate dehydrogenase (decarboxylating) [Enterococcus sp. AZ194]|uniref:phosphogluconate dehydrogenase (NAD(+)-dependent, decarboxylating) n=1 Tax=Enterococcus sp. AZ194 TaxID=2774629 RepID=UPI003F261528